MKRLSVTGGKGGTGKSFIATNLAVILARRFRLVLADLDVEAPNDHILLGHELGGDESEILIFFPKIVAEKCTGCGACAKVCDTGAIIVGRGRIPFIFPRLCSGCKACYYACPYNAIMESGRRVLGYTYVSDVETDGSRFRLVTGIIREGEEHTPPAIVAAKRVAESLEPELLIIDTGAGTGNGISASIQYSDLVIAVTEPTPLGAHDLEAILRVARGMGYKVWTVINRSGIGPEDPIIEIALKHGSERIFRVPYSRSAAMAYARGRPVVLEYPEDEASVAIHRLAESIVEELFLGV